MPQNKEYIIVKDRHPRFSEVLNDCITLCVPTSKNEPLSSVLQKICTKITNLESRVKELEEQNIQFQSYFESLSVECEDDIDCEDIL